MTYVIVGLYIRLGSTISLVGLIKLELLNETIELTACYYTS